MTTDKCGSHPISKKLCNTQTSLWKSISGHNSEINRLLGTYPNRYDTAPEIKVQKTLQKRGHKDGKHQSICCDIMTSRTDQKVTHMIVQQYGLIRPKQ